MDNRIPLQIVEGRLILTSVVECKALRMQRQIMEFVIDTGSPDSYLSQKDVLRLQIPVAGKTSKGSVDFGGSRYQQIDLPKMKMYFLKENRNDDGYLERDVSIIALRADKTSPAKAQIAQSLPSILGLDFLKEQKLSLHVIMSEDMAYLEHE